MNMDIQDIVNQTEVNMLHLIIEMVTKDQDFYRSRFEDATQLQQYHVASRYNTKVSTLDSVISMLKREVGVREQCSNAQIDE